jgi:glutaredoxin
MRLILVSVFCFALHFTCFSQISSNPHVKLVEKKMGKRLQLFAKNTDSIPYAIFLRVITQDYRRTSKRPIMKEIPGNSTQLLKTLILLDGKEGNYTPTFIVNEVSTNLTMRKTHKDFNLKISKAKLEKSVVIYKSTNCDLCDTAITILEENSIIFKSYDIEIDKKAYNALKDDLKNLESLDNHTYPILKIEEDIYTNIETREQFIEILKLHFE